MDLPFPAPPASVRRNLARPSREFRLQAWAAISALILFLVFYFGLTFWFAWIAWKSLATLGGDRGDLKGLLVALPALFLFVVMAKGLFFVRRGAPRGLVEIREQDEPKLHLFVQRVAADVGAPRPHHLFFSSRVNAAVFYDLSLRNLILPSKKNLEVGLGLVNALSLDEFKAVIAHEFGHFAQRTMAVARWVYLAQQFVADLIVRRDALDRFLDGLSRFDLRVAWIGWGLRLVVWSIRSLLDTVFRGVIALERALSRQMEFQADLVAVGVTGSDSLIHGLHRLAAADDAWDRAVHFAFGEKQSGRPVADLFAIQSRILEHLRRVLDDPDRGLTPRVPATDPALHRVFRGGIADTPRMWATHPSNHEREANVKREYFPSVLDSRSAWELIADPDRLRREMTRHWASELGGEGQAEPAPFVDSLQRVDAQFARLYLDRRFHGTYLGRELARHTDRVSDLYAPLDESPRETVLDRLAELYPPGVGDDMNRWRELAQEKGALEGLRAGSLTATGGVIRFRGREVRRKELPALIQQVATELNEIRRRLQDHDRGVRTAHRQAARLVGGGREEQLVGLLELIHYAEHTQARLADADAYLCHIFSLVTADRKVTPDEMERLLSAAANVHIVLKDIHKQGQSVRRRGDSTPDHPETTLGRWLPATFDLPCPTPEDLAQGWLGALENHVRYYASAVGALRDQSLDALVEAEAAVADALRSGSAATPAPASIEVPLSYERLKPGAERPRDERLGWWERFRIADGVLPGAARLATAACILIPALVFSLPAGSKLIVHNGLAAPVMVTIDGRTHEIGPRGTIRVSPSSGRTKVRAIAQDQTEIERFEAEVDAANANVYNLAGASAFVETWATYGRITQRPPRSLGSARWFASDADHVMEDPPKSARAAEGGVALRVVRTLDGEWPVRQLAALESAGDRSALALAHARWDPLDHPDLAFWFEMLVDHPDFQRLWQSRLSTATASVDLQRIRMDHATDEERATLCAALTTQAAARPDDADLAYLSTRCLADGPDQGDKFLTAAQRSPDHMWLQWAASAVRIERGEFSEALAIFEHLVSREDVQRGVLGQRVDMSFIRLRRLLVARPSDADIGPVERWYPEFREWLAVETWATPPDTAPPHDRATFHLLRGGLDEALAVPGLSPTERESVTLLVALSEGATTEQVNAGLAVPFEQLNEWFLLWPAHALAVREGRDPSTILQSIASLSGLPATFAGALEAQGRATRPAAIDAAVVGLSPELRGVARVAGVVLLGDAAPVAWRHEAKALLLPYERPFLR